MIKEWLVVGDLHGRFDIFDTLNYEHPNEVGIICLGDFCVNFYLDSSDAKRKRKLMDYGFHYFLVRGNHEEHPKNLPNIIEHFNPDISNYEYIEPFYPRIHYLMDTKIYSFGSWTAYVAGGAYSIDKEYRLRRAGPNAAWTGWFPNEQCSFEEMRAAVCACEELHPRVDFIFAHTCPYEWQPTDLFLPMVDQSTVDNRTELWLSELIRLIDFKVFLCGHFHDERQLAPKAYMLRAKIHRLEEYIND